MKLVARATLVLNLATLMVGSLWSRSAAAQLNESCYAAAKNLAEGALVQRPAVFVEPGGRPFPLNEVPAAQRTWCQSCTARVPCPS